MFVLQPQRTRRKTETSRAVVYYLRRGDLLPTGLRVTLRTTHFVREQVTVAGAYVNDVWVGYEHDDAMDVVSVVWLCRSQQSTPQQVVQRLAMPVSVGVLARHVMRVLGD